MTSKPPCSWAERRAFIVRTGLCYMAFSQTNLSVAQRFDVLDLGTLGGTNSRAYDVNSSGQVVGWSNPSSGNKRAFVWLPSAAYNLSLGMNDLGKDGVALGINSAGDIVGWLGTPTIDPPAGNASAFLWVNGTFTNLGNLGGASSAALGVNSSTRVVGFSSTNTGATCYGRTIAFRWQSSSGTTKLGTFESDCCDGLSTYPITFANAINNSNHIVGHGVQPAERTNCAPWFGAYVSSNGVAADCLATNDMESLSCSLALAGKSTEAWDINSSDKVVGWVADDLDSMPGTTTAAYWEKINGSWTYTLLPGLGSYAKSWAWGISDSNQVVGAAFTLLNFSNPGVLEPNDDGAAVLWEKVSGNWTVIDLNSELPTGCGIVLRQARAINSSGQIVGWGHVSDRIHAFLLTPCDGVPAATLTSAVSRKTHANQGVQDISINISGHVESGNVTSDPRRDGTDNARGVSELRLTFDAAPHASSCLPLEQQVEQSGCPSGSQSNWSAYSGSSLHTVLVDGTTMIVRFSPGLENAITYRISLSPCVTSVSDQKLEFRALIGDVDNNRMVNGNDRSAVIAVWTGSPPQFTKETDVNLTGLTDANDRSLVIAKWTSSTENCAP